MTAGELTFLPQQFDQTIRVEIMDDFCNERYSEFFSIVKVRCIADFINIYDSKFFL